MNFPHYKNYRDIGLPPPPSSAEVKGYPYDYPFRSSSVVLGHQSNEPLALSASASSSRQQIHDGQHDGRMNVGSGDINPGAGTSQSQGIGKGRGRKPKEPKTTNNSGRERTFGCGSCDKAFYTRQNLQQHERIHTGELPYQCSQCERAFNQLSHLNQHLRSAHNQQKLFPCLQCQKSFSDETRLNKHARQHTGMRVHRCGMCQAEFMQKSLLNKHMTQSHPPPLS